MWGRGLLRKTRRMLSQRSTWGQRLTRLMRQWWPLLVLRCDRRRPHGLVMTYFYFFLKKVHSVPVQYTARKYMSYVICFCCPCQAPRVQPRLSVDKRFDDSADFTVSFEPVDLDLLESIMGLEFAHRLHVHDGDTSRPRPLAMVARDLLVRGTEFRGMLLVVRRNGRLGAETDHLLRTYTGVGSLKGPGIQEALGDYAQKLANVVRQGVSVYDATRSCFTFPKLVKQLFRMSLASGLESGIDLDQNIAAWRSLLSRHPTDRALSQFVQKHEELYLTAGGGDRNIGKALYTPLITGAGQPHLARWESSHPLKAPAFFRELKDAVGKLRVADAVANPALMQTLIERRAPELTLQSVLNEKDEARDTHRVHACLGEKRCVDKPWSIEHDGAYYWPPRGLPATADWRASVLRHAKAVDPSVAVKPYKTLTEVLETLAALVSVPHTMVRANGAEYCADAAELSRRVRKENTIPDQLVAKLAASTLMRNPWSPQDKGFYLLQQICKAVPGAEAENSKIVVKTAVGWVMLPSRNGLLILKGVIVATIKRHLPRDWQGDLPGYCQRSSPLKVAANEILNDYLYDADFHSTMDSESTLRYLQFQCGQVLDRNTMLVCPGSLTDDIIITKRLGLTASEFDLPGRREKELSRKDNLEEVFQTYAANFPIWGARMELGHAITPALISKLDACGGRLPVLRLLFTMFEDWYVVIYLLMTLACRVFGYTEVEQFDVWEGDGSNGKGLVCCILRHLLGNYYKEMAASLLTERRRDPNAPSPAWLTLRGCRVVTITEAESSATCYSSTIKLLRDPQSVFDSRGLRDNLIEWSPTFGMFICTNVHMTFSSLDGGIRRSAACIKWPFKFTGDLSQANDRRGDPSLKQACLQKRMACDLLFILTLVAQTLLPRRLQDSVMRPTPVAVQEATAMFLHEFGSQTNDFVTERLDVVPASGDASTEPQVIAAYLAFAHLETTRANRQEAGKKLGEVLTQINGTAGRKCLRIKGSSTGFVVVKP